MTDPKQLADEIKRLALIARNASFDCGQWISEEPSQTYAAVHDIAIAAWAAVDAAIDRLASLAPPGDSEAVARDAARFP